MSGFVFDAKKARAAIAAREIGNSKPAVLAVHAVKQEASIREPQKPQKPQPSVLRRHTAVRICQPQEPQQPQPRSPRNDFADEIEERAALAADRVPRGYLDSWPRLQCQRPSQAPEQAWEQAVIDAGLFLDSWGDLAEELGWTAGELFDVPRGLVWQLNGERVEALGADHVRLSDGRIILKNGRAHDN